MALAVLGAHKSADAPRLRALCIGLMYKYAARLGVDAATRAGLRSELLVVAEDARAPGYAREKACRVLLTDDWNGRDAWYQKQLADPTLRHLRDGVMGYSPLRWPLQRDPERWVPRLIPRGWQAGAGVT